ncbi:ATP-dependent DNA ligase [Catellatospora aurea]|uniref:ATP-dependent DNA ligase n=1 Tax=Catellatospora aurea TaxID=1337874 RepID=A0ABW2H440_9ACTN
MAATPIDVWPVGPGWLAEPKFDGWRMALYRLPDQVILQSRPGRDLSRYFPEIVAAGMRLKAGTVLDGELVAWSPEGRTDFAALQRRVVRLAAMPSTHLVVFDLLEHPSDGVMVDQPLSARRRALELLLRARPDPRLVLCPQTASMAAASDWMAWGSAGIEGVVLKQADGRYRFGRRDWAKMRARHPVELVVGGVTGALSRPSTLLLGEVAGSGRLVFRGRTGPLRSRDRAELGQLLPVLTGGVRPWPNPLPGRWANLTAQQPLPYEEVEPVLVVEVDVDAAFEAGRWRHPLRYRRIRAELLPMQLLRMAGDDWDQPLE